MSHAESRPPTPRCAPKKACFALPSPSRGPLHVNVRCAGVSDVRESALHHRLDASSHASPVDPRDMPRCAEMYQDVPRDAEGCRAMPRERKRTCRRDAERCKHLPKPSIICSFFSRYSPFMAGTPRRAFFVVCLPFFRMTKHSFSRSFLDISHRF